jgi:hypothetical protein
MLSRRVTATFSQWICVACLAATLVTVLAAENEPLAGITLDSGRLSVELRDAPLAMVVTDIAARSGIQLHLENAAALPRITAHFTDLPFAEGLAQLLKSAPGSLVVRNANGGYGGVTSLYVIASKARPEPHSAATPIPATLDDIRRSITDLQAREMSPGLRQAYDDARAPAHDEMAQVRSLQRTQDLDSLLKEIGSTTANGKGLGKDGRGHGLP